MKEIFFKIQFLVYAVLSFLCALMLESYLSGDGNAEIDIARIESLIQEREVYIEGVLEDIRQEVRSGERIVRKGPIFQIDRDFSNLKNGGFSVFVFEKDTLRFWTDNTVSPERIPTSDTPQNIILELETGWYDARYINDGDYEYVGLFQLKSKYNYTNSYLNNDFHNDFVIDKGYGLSITPVCGSLDVRNKDKAYLFSVVPFSNAETNGSKYNVVFLPLLLSLVMFLIFIDNVIRDLMRRPDSNMTIVFIMLGLVFLRMLVFLFQAPQIIYKIDFFDPAAFRGEGIFATFGDFFFNIVIIFFMVRYVFLLAEYNHMRERVMRMSPSGRITVWAVMAVGYMSLSAYLFYIAHLLVDNCNFSFMFNDLTSLSVYSFSGIAIFLMLNALAVYVSYKIASYFDFGLVERISRLKLIYLLVSLALSLLLWAVAGILSGACALYLMLTLGMLLLVSRGQSTNGLYRGIFLLMIGAAFSSALICGATQDKNYRECHASVINSSGVGDPIAELMLGSISKELPDDEHIKVILSDTDSIHLDRKLYDYIHRHYCSGYWSHYNLGVSAMRMESGQFLSQVDNEFMREKYDRGSKLGNTSFRFVENYDGTFGYYAPIKYVSADTLYYVFLSLNSNPAPNKLGYPSILLKDSKLSIVDSMDYAIYHNGHKVSNRGGFNYDMSDKVFLDKFDEGQGNDSIREMVIGDCIHSVYRSGENTFVSTKESVTFLDFVIQFAYMFVIFVIVTLILLAVRMLAHGNIRKEFVPIKTRLVVWVSGILLIAFVAVCVCMVLYNIHSYKQQDDNRIEEKISGIYMHMVQDCSDTLAFHCTWSDKMLNTMDEYVVDLSHVFFTDINIYGPDGMLIACSRPEIFGLKIVGTRMNCEAMKEFILHNKSSLIQEETISKMKYVAAYMPFYNKNDDLIAYINLAYFTKTDDFEKEIWTQIVSIVNLYVVLLMISIFLAVFVSDSIIRPIKMIQDKMVTMELGKNHEKIEYNRDDEIGQLVAEYNTMVDKLAESAKIIEKEGKDEAWKTMARQVAHEIKNPLTPMQLSTQFLKRAWDDHKPDFGERLSKFTETMIQQIETLSSIATSFSNFAKMPKPEERPLNVIDILDNVVALYQNIENVDVTSDFGGHKEIVCMLDKEQITRVFVNIIKNATQAIPDSVRGKIHVSLELKEPVVVISIADNGTGIPDEIRGKLFTPNFTTKSAGSGLGLAMVKSMVENVKGNITFESEVGKGTTFMVTLPLKAD